MLRIKPYLAPYDTQIKWVGIDVFFYLFIIINIFYDIGIPSC